MLSALRCKKNVNHWYVHKWAIWANDLQNNSDANSLSRVTFLCVSLPSSWNRSEHSYISAGVSTNLPMLENMKLSFPHSFSAFQVPKLPISSGKPTTWSFTPTDPSARFNWKAAQELYHKPTLPAQLGDCKAVPTCCFPAPAPKVQDFLQSPGKTKQCSSLCWPPWPTCFLFYSTSVEFGFLFKWRRKQTKNPPTFDYSTSLNQTKLADNWSGDDPHTPEDKW